MKIARLLLLVAVFCANIVQAAEKPSAGAAVPKGKSMSKAELTALVSDTHWTWYEGRYDRYEEGMPHWIEIYKDGSARVPWRGHPQLWTVKGPNVLMIRDSGKNGDLHTFYMNGALKAGSAQNQNLHIRYEKTATRPEGWK
jgi:hypothetical protein